jgi:purine-binding chemotaxis protein CheW
MSSDSTWTTDRIAELRDAFDSAFARTPLLAADDHEDLLAIRVGGNSYAVRLSEVSGLYADKLITALPGVSRTLLGIAGFRGAIVAVYDLRTLLGDVGSGSCRWLVLAASDSTIGFAFDQFEGHLQVPRNAVASEGGMEFARVHTREAVTVADNVRPILQISTLLDTIKRPREAEEKER